MGHTGGGGQRGPWPLNIWVSERTHKGDPVKIESLHPSVCEKLPILMNTVLGSKRASSAQHEGGGVF